MLVPRREERDRYMSLLVTYVIPPFDFAYRRSSHAERNFRMALPVRCLISTNLFLDDFTYADVHGSAAVQTGLRGVRALRSVTERAADHAGHLNVRLIRVMLYSERIYKK